MVSPHQPETFTPAALSVQWRLDGTPKEKRSISKTRSEDDVTGPSENSSFAILDAPARIRNLPLRSRISQYLAEDIDTEWADIILIVCTFSSGVVDGAAFNAWGSFANMQTGNTIFLALGVSGQPIYPDYLWAKALIAIVTFIIGNLFFIRAHRFLGSIRRSTLFSSFALQTSLVLISSILVQVGVVRPKPEDPRAPIQWMQVLPLAFLAFQAAGQIVSSRVLKLDEMPTVVVTSMLCDLLVDKRLFDGGLSWRRNGVRNRRLATFIALFAGAMTSEGLTRAAGLPSSLWLATALKAAATVAWLFWRAKVPDVEMGR